MLNSEQRKLVEDNTKLVHFVLNKMHITMANKDYEDYFQVGCVGLCKAAVS